MQPWDRSFERECHALVVDLCDAGRPPRARDVAWRGLLERVAPHVEAWAAASPVLRRCGLDSDDDARGVLVEVITRLQRRDFENLRRYLAARPPAAGSDDDSEELAVVESLARLAPRRDETPTETTPEGDVLVGTPLRGWLLGLTRFAVKDHVKQRLGWSSSARATFLVEPATGACAAAALLDALRAEPGILTVEHEPAARTLAVEHLAGTISREALVRRIEARGWHVADADRSASKRDVGTDAERLDRVPDAGERPPITDLMALRQLLGQMRDYIATFPAPMRKALDLWMADEDYDVIAAQVGVEDADKARALVRAAQARLRQRFRATNEEAA